ncbi:MAG: hypothetical protein ABIJ39_09120 [Chloroflexota bacterium]
MKDWLYQLLTGVLDMFVWGGELIGEENLPLDGPAVFIANHVDALGPIAVACSIPMRMNTWAIGDMLDREKSAAYLNTDFVERQLHLKPPVSIWVSRGLSKITVPLLASLGCIPVYKGYEAMQATWALSMELLLDEKLLLIFPEEPSLPADPVTGMKPFQRSFARLGEMYSEAVAKKLRYYPIAIHPNGYVMVGGVIVHNPLNAVGLERRRLKDLLEAAVKEMYLSLDGKELVGVLSPQRK